jgi:hypothetical protein
LHPIVHGKESFADVPAVRNVALRFNGQTHSAGAIE